MRSMIGFAGRSYVASVVVNSVLCITIGALLGGLRGSQLGLAAGIILAVLPTIVRLSAAWLTRPDGLARLIAREVSAVAVRVAVAIASVLARLFSPVVRLLQGPVLLLRFAATIVAGAAAATLDVAGRALATPLGLANLGALAVIAVNFTAFELAAPVAFMGLGLLVLVLFVSEREAAEGAAGQLILEAEDETNLGEHS